MGGNDKLSIQSRQQFDMLGQLLLKCRSHGVLRFIKQIERLIKKMLLEILQSRFPVGGGFAVVQLQSGFLKIPQSTQEGVIRCIH